MVSFVEEVASTLGGENIWNCIQCGVCSGVCPAASEMEYPPRRTIALIRAGMRDEVLSSNSMWYCLSCYMCTVRCPKGVKPTELAHAIEYLSTQNGYNGRGRHTLSMYRSFVSSIWMNGRVHEFGVIRRYYLTINPLTALKMLKVGLQLFLHRRLPLRATRVNGNNNLSKIIKEFREVRDRK